jgi:hypothetical protein
LKEVRADKAIDRTIASVAELAEVDGEPGPWQGDSGKLGAYPLEQAAFEQRVHTVDSDFAPEHNSHPFGHGKVDDTYSRAGIDEKTQGPAYLREVNLDPEKALAAGERDFRKAAQLGTPREGKGEQQQAGTQTVTHVQP